MNFLKNLGIKEILLILFCLAVGVIFFVFAKSAYPVPGGDSEFFLVPALQLSNHGILSNPLFIDEKEANLIDPSGMKRFLFYPPLYPLVLNRGVADATPVDVMETIAAISALVIWLCAWIFYRFAKKDGGLNWPNFFAIILGLLAVASGLIGDSGRPEILAGLWVALGVMVFLHVKGKYDWVLYGILSGLVFATHLMGGFISLLVLGAVFSARLKPKEFFMKIIGTSVLAAATLCSVIAIGPFGVKETLIGTVKNALAVGSGYTAQLSSLFTFSNFIQYYVLSPATPFYAFVVILMVVSAIYFYKKYKDGINSPVLFILCVIGLILALASMLYSLGHIFYLIVFSPVIFLGFILYSSEAGKIPKIAAFAILALVSTAFLRTLVMFPSFLSEKPTFADARKAFNKTALEYGKSGLKIGVTGSFWALSENYADMYMYNSWPEKPKENTSFIFFQQKYSGMLQPPDVPGCSLSDDKFSPEAPKLFGIKLGNTTPGYNYAIYKCS